MPRLPGIGTSKTYTPRDILKTDLGVAYYPSSIVIDGSESRDSGNTGDVDVLRPGLLVSRMSSGLYATTVLGVTAAAYASGTTLTVSAACATEINRRYGSSGTSEFAIFGLSDMVFSDETVLATGEWVSHSAVNTTTGAITITALQSTYPYVGSWIVAAEAVRNIANAQLNNTFIINEHIKVTDDDGTTAIDVGLSKAIVAGVVDVSKIINYPVGNERFGQWIKEELRDGKIGLSFSDDI